MGHRSSALSPGTGPAASCPRPSRRTRSKTPRPSPDAARGIPRPASTRQTSRSADRSAPRRRRRATRRAPPPSTAGALGRLPPRPGLHPVRDHVVDLPEPAPPQELLRPLDHQAAPLRAASHLPLRTSTGSSYRRISPPFARTGPSRLDPDPCTCPAARHLRGSAGVGVEVTPARIVRTPVRTSPTVHPPTDRPSTTDPAVVESQGTPRRRARFVNSEKLLFRGVEVISKCRLA